MVMIPVSSFGYVFGLLIELVFIVVEARIEARNSDNDARKPSFYHEFRYKLRHRQT